MAVQRLAVTLAEEAVYVYGTVNGDAVTWTNTANKTWEATAARSPNDIYDVYLQVYKPSGAYYTASARLYYGVLNLIYDRTQADVDRVRFLSGKAWDEMTDSEKAEWSTALKGAYNADDLNRVESAVQFVAQFLRDTKAEYEQFMAEKQVAMDDIFDLGYTVPEFIIKTDWAEDDIPKDEDNKRYLFNVDRLTDIIPVIKNLPRSMEKLDFNGANEIEKSVLLEYNAGRELDREKRKLVELANQAFIYSDEIFCGEV